jgi:hypothetical protein
MYNLLTGVESSLDETYFKGFFDWFVCFFEMGFHYIAQTVLELCTWPRLALNSKFPCLRSTRVKGVQRIWILMLYLTIPVIRLQK